jgi:hypothetical protein
VTHLVAGTGLVIAAEATKANAYLGPMVTDGNPMGSWITWEVLAMVIGGMDRPSWQGAFGCNWMGNATSARRSA